MKPLDSVCPYFQYNELLYLSNELSPEDRQRFEIHLKGCPHCQLRLKQAQEVVSQLVPLNLIPSHQCLERVNAEITQRAKSLSATRLTKLRLVRWAGAVVAACIGIFILASILINPIHERFIPPEDNVVFQWENGTTSELAQLSRQVLSLELGQENDSSEVLYQEDALEGIREAIDKLSKKIDEQR